MIYFIYGEDTYRSKKKIDEIVLGYKKVHKSGLNLIYFNIGDLSNKNTKTFHDFYGKLQINPMFSEKKLVIVKNAFEEESFQGDFLEKIKEIECSDNIIVIFEEGNPDARTKFFKVLQKSAKCQEFKYLQPALLRKWVTQEFDNKGIKINIDALEILISFVGNNLWQMSNEINKLYDYQIGSIVKKEDIEKLVKPNIENDIFKTIDALASKNKKLALSLIHKHLDDGEAPLKLLAMVSYQFRTLLTIKEMQKNSEPYNLMAKKSGLHPFVIQKNYHLCNQFSLEQLKKIYLDIFQIDSDIKTGKLDSEIALDLFISQI